MDMDQCLDREEYIEQAYFFRTMRERLEQRIPTQEILRHVHEEILSTTSLPMAIQFLGMEIKHTGLLSSGFRLLPHYFAPFQRFVIEQTEDVLRRFNIEMGMLVLEREAKYRADNPTPAGLFVYQLETLSRNRMGYEEGLESIRNDPMYDAPWKEYVDMVRRQLGAVDFAEMVYLRSEYYVTDQRRQDAGYQPPWPALFAEKEGKIAKANRGRDPLYLFAAMQRQLGYPEVPHFKPKDDINAKIDGLRQKIKDLEARIKLVEGEVKGQVDLSEYMVKPEDFPQDDDEDKK
jgi:hypothetical protein